MNNNFYFHKHSLKYNNVLIELINTFDNNREEKLYKHNYYKDYYCEDYCKNYEEYYEEYNYNEKLYGDYDDWEDYYSSIYD